MMLDILGLPLVIARLLLLPHRGRPDLPKW
jgi:hypothetical protein